MRLAAVTTLCMSLALAVPGARAGDSSPQAGASPLESDRASELEFPQRLGSYTTTLLGSLAARTVNVRLAAEALDGLVLEPGDVLSFNATVGARTIDRGYQQAPVILHETRHTQTGGGVCQVASTVFLAGLLSGLDVVERWRHSSPVDYVAAGEDATIAWGAKDLRLRNALPHRLRLRVRVAGATLSAHFEAEDSPAGSWELVLEERELPADADGAVGGREIELHRVWRGADGSEERLLVHRDVIPPSRVRESER